MQGMKNLPKSSMPHNKFFSRIGLQQRWKFPHEAVGGRLSPSGGFADGSGIFKTTPGRAFRKENLRVKSPSQVAEPIVEGCWVFSWGISSTSPRSSSQI